MLGSTMLVGFALCGLVLAGGVWPWVLLVVGLAISVEPTLRWTRERRARDP